MTLGNWNASKNPIGLTSSFFFAPDEETTEPLDDSVIIPASSGRFGTVHKLMKAQMPLITAGTVIHHLQSYPECKIHPEKIAAAISPTY